MGPGVQALPQAPQWLVVSRRASHPSATLLLQLAKPALQLTMRHMPAMHAPVAFAGAHARPQPPQWARFVLVSTHAPEHSVPLVH
jgi:hypothetical protein